MITIEKTFPGTIAYPLERLGDPEKLEIGRAHV